MSNSAHRGRDLNIHPGTSKQVLDGGYMKHRDGHEWGLAGWSKTGLLKFYDFGLNRAILDLFDYVCEMHRTVRACAWREGGRGRGRDAALCLITGVRAAPSVVAHSVCTVC